MRRCELALGRWRDSRERSRRPRPAHRSGPSPSCPPHLSPTQPRHNARGHPWVSWRGLRDPPCGFASYTSYTNQQEAVMRAPLLGGLTIVALVALGSCKDDVGITATATGSAQFTYLGDIKTLFFEVDVAGIDSVTLAHIHGPADTGTSAGVALNLYTTGKSKGLGFTGVLSSGVGGEVGPPSGMTLDSLLVLMRNGHAYVNV